MNVLSQWWATAKSNEGILQIFGRDPSGNVSDGFFVGDSSEKLTTPYQDCILLSMFYNGSEEEGRKNFKKFFDLSECVNRISLQRMY